MFQKSSSGRGERKKGETRKARKTGKNTESSKN
jgi:hypothetical protein